MQKNDLFRNEDTVLRVLDIKADKLLVIDCIKRTMPKWITTAALSKFKLILEKELLPCKD